MHRAAPSMRSGDSESEFTFKLEKYIRIGGMMHKRHIYIERESRGGPINIVSCHEIVL